MECTSDVIEWKPYKKNIDGRVNISFSYFPRIYFCFRLILYTIYYSPAAFTFSTLRNVFLPFFLYNNIT